MKKLQSFFFFPHMDDSLHDFIDQNSAASGEMLNEDKRGMYTKLIIRRKGVVKIIEASKGWWLEADRP